MTAAIFQAQARAFADRLCAEFPECKLRITGDEVRGRCPLPEHDDRNPSFGFSISGDCWACSCGGGKRTDLARRLGWGEFAGEKKPRTPWRPPPLARLVEVEDDSDGRGEPDETYIYANGNRKLKWRSPKRVAWRHESGEWRRKGDPGIYRVDSIPSGYSGAIHWSESESDADALAEAGFIAVATPDGAGRPIKAVPAGIPHTAMIVVWEHRDAPGAAYAEATISTLQAADVRAAIARAPKPHKDVRDWLAAGATAAELERAAETALRGFGPPEIAQELIEADLDDLEYVLRPLVARGNLTLLQGEPKRGKSTFALLVALSASLGVWRGGRWFAGQPTPTLFFSWEDGRRRIRNRLKQYVAGLAEPFEPAPVPTHLYIYAGGDAPRIRLDDPGSVAKLRSVVRETDAGLVVIDTLSHLTAGDENAKKDMQPILDALKDIAHDCNCAVLLLHHTGKPGKDPAGRSIVYRSRGSSAIAAAADVILDWGDRGSGNVTPCRLISKDDDDDEFSVEYVPEDDNRIVRWRLVDFVEADDRYGNRKKIIETLAALAEEHPEGVTRAQLVAATGLHRNTITYHLEAMSDYLEAIEEEDRDGRGRKTAKKYLPVTAKR